MFRGFFITLFFIYSEVAEISYKGNTEEVMYFLETDAYSLLFICNYIALCVTSVFLVILLFTCIAPVPSVDIVQNCYTHLFIYLQISILCLFFAHSHDFKLPLRSLHTSSISIPNQCTISSSLYPDIPLTVLLSSVALCSLVLSDFKGSHLSWYLSFHPTLILPRR